MTFEIIFLISMAILAYTRFKDKEAVRVQLDSVAKFLAFMAMVTCIRIAVFDFTVGMGGTIPVLPPELLEMGMWRLLMVFWEDCFYVLPIYLVSRKEAGINVTLKYYGKVIKTIGKKNKFNIPWIGKKQITQLWKPITWAIALGLSVHFGMGHAYQGMSAVVITMLYPFFISYRYGRKVGFGTVMVCHILYDFITFYTIYFLPNLLP